MGRVTFHHVRFCGSPKNDERGLSLCVAHHLHDGGRDSIERGKAAWAQRFSIDIEAEIENYRRLYVESGGTLKSAPF